MTTRPSPDVLPETPEAMRDRAFLYLQLAHSTGLPDLADDFRWKARELEARAVLIERAAPVPDETERH
jgi:hypothetical protein